MEQERETRQPAWIPGFGAMIDRSRITILAIAFALGIALADALDGRTVWLWLSIAFIAGAIVLVARRLGPRVRLASLAVGACAIGGAWLVVHHHWIGEQNLASMTSDQRMLVRMQGVAIHGPETRHRTAGSLAEFDYREPATYIPTRVTALVDRNGNTVEVSGGVLVRVDEVVEPFHAGDRIEAIGYLQQPGTADNPAAYDYRDLARALDQAGILNVTDRRLLKVTPMEHNSLIEDFRGWRDSVRARAGGLLFSDMPGGSIEREGLLAALILGERDRSIDHLTNTFRQLGLGHLLAISGLHLAILAGAVLLVLRMGGKKRRWHGLLVIAVVLGYLLLIEVRLPVMRAAVMTIVACFALLTHRSLAVGGLVSLSAIMLLVWRPDQLFSPGFQLSFGVVLGLVHLGMPFRRKLFGLPDLQAATTGAMIMEWLKTTFAAALLAWLVATPIVVEHFGVFSPMAAVLSVIALPAVAVLLVGGYLKMVLAIILPSAALLVGVPLAFVADVVIAGIAAADAMPGTSMDVPAPGAVWTILSLVWVVALVFVPGWKRAMAAIVPLVAWPFVHVAMIDHGAALRIDMLSVGDGSSYVIRSRGHTIIFDAGSSTDLDAGRRTIVPAMRELGVRRVDAVAISHANIDHYGAAIEIVEHFDVGTVFCTPQFLDHAENDPEGPVAFVVDHFTRNFVSVTPMSAGDAREFGGMEVRWLHPRRDDEFTLANDLSMVLQIASAGRSVLLCGDIQREGIAHLMEREGDGLQADVMELPHHGSYNDTAVALLEFVDPDVILQSTGPSRFERDRWHTRLGDSDRLVTARDGACSVIIDHDGTITTQRFLPH